MGSPRSPQWEASNLSARFGAIDPKAMEKPYPGSRSMGESLSRSIQSCYDPEGTAAIIRKKKAQRAALNQYDELLKRVTDRDPSAVQEVMQFDQENKLKGQGEFKGKFWIELQQHDDWPQILQKRASLGVPPPQ
eukprot:Skav221379  [mRNA]  locus=scaffold2286:298970:303587:- [translate_table: standard]